MVLGVTVADAADGSEVPYVFVAVTVNVYEVPGVSPVTVKVLAVVRVLLIPPAGFDVTVYAVMGEPPVDVGAVNTTVAVVLPVAVEVPIPGAVGRPNVATDEDGEDATEVPYVFVAVTVNVYEVPGVSPLTVMVPAPAWDTVPVKPPGSEVAVYPLIVEPPSYVGVLNATVAVVVPVAVEVPIRGARGTPRAVMFEDNVDDEKVPAPPLA